MMDLPRSDESETGRRTSGGWSYFGNIYIPGSEFGKLRFYKSFGVKLRQTCFFHTESKEYEGPAARGLRQKIKMGKS